MRGLSLFDYQSNRHCAKTADARGRGPLGLITSQIDTAPKLIKRVELVVVGLITSQIDTAPKLAIFGWVGLASLITSQIDTAPKLAPLYYIKNEV